MLTQNPKKKISLKLLKIGLTLVPFKKGNMLKNDVYPQKGDYIEVAKNKHWTYI